MDFLIDRQDDDLARATIDHLPTARPGRGYVLVRRMAAGWEPQHIVSPWERTDRWLVNWETAAREKLAQRKLQPWHEDEIEFYWFRLRVRLHQEVNNIPWLMKEMEEQLRRNPGDSAAAHRCVTLSRSVDPPLSLKWLLDVVRPEGAYDAYRLGEVLAGPWPGMAVTMFERSLTLPLTDADEAAMNRLSAMTWQRKDLERSLRWQTRAALAEAYQKNDQADKAQSLIESLATESSAEVPPGLAALAGRVQATTGARVIERRILEQEEAKADSPEYWTNRARYFVGRGEHEQADEAYRKALALSPLDPDSPRFKDMTFRRSQTLSAYVPYLQRQKGDAVAIALIWNEFDSVSPNSEYARRMVNEMEWSFRAEVHVDNVRLWVWLAARPTWDHLERSVLHQIAGGAKPQHDGDTDRRDEVWAKAQPLVQDAHPSRAAMLGEVMTRHNANGLAVPLLRDAIARLEDDDAKARATFTLFEAYLNLHDAKNAESLWPQARRRLTGDEIPDWLGRLIDAAETSQDPATAQRLKNARANLDHRFAP
ncbi:MAG: hypothetical protein JXA69_00010 [Phycisphaerae bacterium]|nr:hypothetical protein [Phycisphaerae bacterium]